MLTNPAAFAYPNRIPKRIYLTSIPTGQTSCNDRLRQLVCINRAVWYRACIAALS